jgi:hypothetical protein
MIAPGMIIAALVLIAVAVGVVVVVGGGGDDGLNAAGAADGFAALSDDAEYDDTGYAELRRCPLGDPQDLGERVADTLDLADDVVDGDSYQYISDRTDDLPESLWCVAGADLSLGTDGDTFAFTASRLPDDDYDRYLEDIALPEGNVELGDLQQYRGGTIYPYCFEPDDESLGSPGCGADWVAEDDDIVVGLSYTSGDADADAAVDALKDVLPDLVDELADQA